MTSIESQLKVVNDLSAPLSVIGAVTPILLSKVAPGDASIILHNTALITNAWFDAIAPYNNKTKGIYSNINKVGRSLATDENRSVSILYASHKILKLLHPEHKKDWNQLLKRLELDPKDKSIDPLTPVGIGNLAGKGVVKARKYDGLNLLGTSDARSLAPYADTTGYAPVNSGESIVDLRKWQPDTIFAKPGTYFSQQFITPQWADTKSFNYQSNSIIAPFPSKSYAVENGLPQKPYKDQVKQLFEINQNFSEKRKLKSEFFEDKIRSLGFSTVATAIGHELSLEEFVQLDFLVNFVAFDTGISIWENKRRYDAVRPFSAIRHLYQDEYIKDFRSLDPQNDDLVLGRYWKPYLQSSNHPEYPSATAGFARSHTEATKLYLKNIMGYSDRKSNDLSFWDSLMPVVGDALFVDTGESLIEPGAVPDKPTQLSWKTWDDFANDAGKSRLWAGVHFKDAVTAGFEIGNSVATSSFDWYQEILGL